MERLTKTGQVFTFPKVDPAENAYLERVQRRLAAYEDTGLEPDEVDQICRASKTMMFKSVADFVQYSIANFDALQAYHALGTVEELAALVKARDEGRAVVLPEKLPKYAKQTSVELDCMTDVCEPCGDYTVKPCPFCGSKNIVYWQYRHAAGLRWRIVCLHCLAMIDPGWVQEYGYLAEMWNARAEAEAAQREEGQDG